MAKPPYMGQLIHVRPDGKRLRYPWAAMSLKLHHLMFCNLYEFRFPDLTFAGGEGSEIFADAQRLWRDYDLRGVVRHAYPQQPFHQIQLRRVRHS